MHRFGELLSAGVEERTSLCVGIDPHPYLLASWGLADEPASLEAFGLAVVEAAAGRVAVVKPQVAFFERFGAAGYAALEHVLAAAREAGLLIIGDAKRGDVGTSVAAYGQAWLTPGSSLEVDALTVSAFQGVASLRDVIQLARDAGKGLFVLCATSNPEAATLQSAQTPAGVSVARAIADEVAQVNAEDVSEASPVGSFGLVVGATIDRAAFGLELDTHTPILAPGFGAQGAALGDFFNLYPTPAPVLASVSRSVLQHGPSELATAIDHHLSQLHG